MDAENPLPRFLDGHLRELRRRVLVVFVSVVGCTALAYYFSRPIAAYLIQPIFAASLEVEGLIYTNLTEAFVGYLKVAVLVGVAASFPVGCYELWMFVAPGLRGREKKVALTVSFWATLLFLAGMVFAYFVALPEILTFLLKSAGPQLEAKPRFDSYLTFTVRTAIAFGLAFEIPFLMVAAGRTGLVERRYFVEKRWLSYGAILILAFLLAAGDLLGAVLLALPLIVLYEVGVLLMILFYRRPPR
ncbi:MAG: twin-arginine translocase subunit TatC [Desulfurivibrionaceae bacterium]|nr:twin-arginine translocase subunit TatC [Desulfobulbales bacterium]MDT8335839.1 twin-arginine translocase subunit TatC [Desulfurivibrionaceae bacterium]